MSDNLYKAKNYYLYLLIGYLLIIGVSTIVLVRELFLGYTSEVGFVLSKHGVGFTGVQAMVMLYALLFGMLLVFIDGYSRLRECLRIRKSVRGDEN